MVSVAKFVKLMAEKKRLDLLVGRLERLSGQYESYLVAIEKSQSLNSSHSFARYGLLKGEIIKELM